MYLNQKEPLISGKTNRIGIKCVVHLIISHQCQFCGFNHCTRVKLTLEKMSEEHKTTSFLWYFCNVSNMSKYNFKIRIEYKNKI